MGRFVVRVELEPKDGSWLHDEEFEVAVEAATPTSAMRRIRALLEAFFPGEVG